MHNSSMRYKSRIVPTVTRRRAVANGLGGEGEEREKKYTRLKELIILSSGFSLSFPFSSLFLHVADETRRVDYTIFMSLI